MKIVILLAIQILIIQIQIFSLSAKLRLQRKIKCNRKNAIVVTLMLPKVNNEGNVSISNEISVFNVAVCQPSVSNNYCKKVNTIWFSPPCHFRYSNNYRFKVKCIFESSFLRKFDNYSYYYSTFGLKFTILHKSGKGNEMESIMFPFTPLSTVCWNYLLK